MVRSELDRVMVNLTSPSELSELLGYISVQKDSDGEEARKMFEAGTIVEGIVDGKV